MADDLRAVNPRARLFRTILSVYGIGIYIFLFAPIAVMVLLSFNASSVVGFPMAGFTTDWYAKLPHDTVVLDALGRTLLVAFWVCRALDAHRDHGSVSAGACQHQESRWHACFHHAADHDAGSADRCGHLGAGLQCAAHPALAEGRDHRADRAGHTVRHPGGVIAAGGAGSQLRARRGRPRCQPATATSVRGATAGLSGHHCRCVDSRHLVFG